VRHLALLLVSAVMLAPGAALAKGPFPKTIALPGGWRPEGIAIGAATTFYVGSIPTGAIYRGDLRTGKGSILIQGAAGRAATGLDYDRGRLFVCGATTGKAFVYDTKTRELIREYQLAAGAGATFVNDVAVTKSAAYFTDSSRAVIYKLPLSASGQPAASAQAIALTGDFRLVSGFNLNGIEATADGRTLVVVQSATGKVFTIDPKTGGTKAIDLGQATLVNGDGLLLLGRTLYVVQNQDNRIAVVELAPNLREGTVVRSITDPGFDIPTTIGRLGGRLYAVNARFTTPPTPATPYTVVQTRR
jgi:sugar lactone lactonase YvrE